jgi:hypothetical protein
MSEDEILAHNKKRYPDDLVTAITYGMMFIL